jgi:hypothetical protein
MKQDWNTRLEELNRKNNMKNDLKDELNNQMKVEMLTLKEINNLRAEDVKENR